MGWLFWRSKKLSQPESVSTKKRPASHEADAENRVDPAQQLRIRARRRLIGAAALLLAVAVVVPMVLDDNARPVADNVPIDIPSEKTPFTPRLALPPVPEPGNVPLAPPPDTGDAKDEVPAKPAPAKDAKAKGAEGGSKAAPAKATDKTSAAPAEKPLDKPAEKGTSRVAEKTDKPAEKVASTAAAAKPVEKTAEKPAENARKSDGTLAAADEQRAREILEGKSSTKTAAAARPAAARFALQAAAPREESDAQELAERLKKAGYASYVERVEAKDGTRFRVRVGPFASRDEAERVRARLRALDVNATLVAPGT